MTILPVVLFDDIELWATGRMRTLLAARGESYAAGVYVGNSRPSADAWKAAHPTSPYPTRMITVRRDGGPRLDAVREAPRLGINVWGKTDQEAGDLARLTAALLWASPDGDPVCKVTITGGPYAVPDESTQPRFYFTAELTSKGSDA